VTPADERIAALERRLETALGRIDALEAENRALREENARLRARVAELEHKLGENSSNSGKPPSSDPPSARAARPKDAPSGRRPGGQPGHKGKRREQLPPEKVTHRTECFPESCRRCGAELPQTADDEPLRHQVVDIPKIDPTVHEYVQHRVTCACGTTTCGTLPVGTPRGLLGPGVLALVGLLIADCHVSRRKVQALLLHVLGIKVSLGALSESEEIVSDAVAAAVEEARQDAIAAKVKHVDATTWYRAGSFRALWTMATATVTVFYIAADATRDALRAWLQRAVGVLVSDRGPQFDFWAMERRQICWAHLFRKFASFSTRGGRAGAIGEELLGWSHALLHAWHRVRDGTITRASFRRTAVPIRAFIEQLLEEGATLPGKGVAGACRNILEHRDAMWYFVDASGVEPTNNHAERELRGFVLWRKNTAGSRSDRGDRFAANLKSVVHTCRKQDRPVLPYCRWSPGSAEIWTG
jgi:transposase